MRRSAAAAGILGPLLFAVVVTILTVIQYPFMRSLGWDPVRRPTFDWPSGLALGPFGPIMTITFLVSGALLSLFACGLRTVLPERTGQIGTMLMTWAGVPMMSLAFATDPTLDAARVTWHGQLHDLAFAVLGLLLIPGMTLLALTFRKVERWKDLSAFTWFTIAVTVPTFAFKGLVFYAFLATMLAWSASVAIRLWTLQP